ncbi:MAG: Photosystem I reaction center subunit IX [Leptolyngbyaceae cyanobacterium bins.59]|nr:Photosystem I reaction center subunit IX [Leptolyngbyaceae cyanobacterium bins.59]
MQGKFFGRYLSNAPVLAVLFVSLALTAFILINKAFPDGLSMTP